MNKCLMTNGDLDVSQKNSLRVHDSILCSVYTFDDSMSKVKGYNTNQKLQHSFVCYPSYFHVGSNQMCRCKYIRT